MTVDQIWQSRAFVTLQERDGAASHFPPKNALEYANLNSLRSPLNVNG